MEYNYANDQILPSPHPRTPKKGSVLQFGAEIHSIWLKAGADRLGRGSARVHSNLDIFGRLGIYICYIFSQNHYYATPHAQRAPEGDYGLIRSAINWAESHPCSGFPPHPRLPPHHNRPTDLSLLLSPPPLSFQSPASFFPQKSPTPFRPFFEKKGWDDKETERGREKGENQYHRAEGKKRSAEETRRNPRISCGRAYEYTGEETRERESEWNHGKEISSVNGENPYPGSNDRGMDETGDRESGLLAGSQRERNRGEEGRRSEERERERKGTLSWFPSGDFIMASSYYRRTSGHERDTILRQGTEADLTSGQIYGRTSGLSILSRKADRPNRTKDRYNAR